MKDLKTNRLLQNSHISTIFPAFFRQVDFLPTFRERIQTPDHDFLDLDWFKHNQSTLVILSHGLEGSSRAPYILGMAQALAQDFDLLAWNYRSCSGALNLTPKLYHSGFIEDLETVIHHAQTFYENIVLVGFSLGGNLTLKYLATNPHPKVVKAVSISAPLDLKGSSFELAKLKNRLYMDNFLITLKQKVFLKKQQFPKLSLDWKKIAIAKNFIEYDDLVTAPLHGFESCYDYWEKASAYSVLHQIKIPTLILSAFNDPFLSESCFPRINHQSLTPLFLEYGGHVGFMNAFFSQPISEPLVRNFLLSDK